MNKKGITIITGSLGSGKTTVLQKLLAHPALNAEVAVIVNEFGKVGLDHYLLRKAEEKTKLLQAGCICCNAREDLAEELKALLFAAEKKEISFDRIMIETTGLADPAPILFTIMTNPILQNRFHIDTILTTVDAKNALRQLKNHEETAKQITVADVVALTKIDLVTLAEKEAVKETIKQLNPTCQIIEVENGVLHPSVLKNGSALPKHIATPAAIGISHQASSITSSSFTFKKPLNWNSFGLWLSMLLHSRGEDVLRVKGLLDVGEEGPIILNGVQHIIHPPIHLEQWPENDHHSHIVFITKNIPTEVLKTSLFAFQNFLQTEVSVLTIA